WDTTQTSPASRRASAQTAQGSASVRSQQTPQKRVFCLASLIAAASAAASSGAAGRMWKARRAAVLSAMPGGFAGCWTRRAMGEAYTSGPEEPWRQRQPPRRRAELRLSELPRPLKRDVHGAHREVLDHAPVADDRRVDGDRDDLALSVGDAADEA